MWAEALNIVPKWQSNDKYRTQLSFSATGTKADDAVFWDETKKREMRLSWK